MSKLEEIREIAEADLVSFIELVAPKRMLGSVHRELCEWWTRQDAKEHQLVLLPRGHQKSTLIAYRAAWEIAKNPCVTILYLSATAGLAQKQLYLIKQILESPIFTRYWPHHLHREEGKREKWTESEIILDHPRRKVEGIRDATVLTAGLTTNVVGFHADIIIYDDIVVGDNAYTHENRESVKSRASMFTSIANPDARFWAVGTRYHPTDLYDSFLKQKYVQFDKHGNPRREYQLWEVFERQVEDRGDGTGEFLWPRQQRQDGVWFGFNIEVLSKVKGQYDDKTQFFAQYYNNPNNPEGSGINREAFQYYDPKDVTRSRGYWYYKGRRISVYAAFDIAFTETRKADFSAIVVIGIDADRNIFVLDVERFKTDRISEYFKKIQALKVKWDFKKLRAECTAAQKVIIKDLIENYIKPHGLVMTVDQYTPSRHVGTKEERVTNILEHRYTNQQIYHYRGGNCQILEDELVLENPPHDDCKDALAAAVDVAVPPVNMRGRGSTSTSNITSHPRFGGY